TGTRDAAAFARARAAMPGRRALAPPGCRSPAAATCGQVLDSSSVNKLVASLTPGTCSDRLWLLPSGPDQVHQTAMRGGPPPALYAMASTSQAGVSPQSGRGMRGKLLCKTNPPPSRQNAMGNAPSAYKHPGRL